MRVTRTFTSAYLIGAAIVWAGLFMASAIILAGTPYFAQMLPILSGGAVFFVILVPGAFFRKRRETRQSTLHELMR